MLKLTPDNVREVYLACLFDDSVPREVAQKRAIVVEGVTFTTGFDPDKIRELRTSIDDLLDQLPERFEKGWSFLNLCDNREGELWTGEHQLCQELVMLGIAHGRMSYCMSRDMWSILPGGMPYVLLTPRKETS